MDYSEISVHCRPLPFWSWNARLDVSESREQIMQMEQAGMGGFFIHARGGLTTAYLEEEWFENVAASIRSAADAGLDAWIYDENGWPSGSASGKIYGMGSYFQQKYLVFHRGDSDCEHLLFRNEAYTVAYEINPYYIDILNPETTKLFLEHVYNAYYKRFGASFTGFFTDEPQLPQSAIPWSHILPDAYESKYHEDLLCRLPELFEPIDDYKRTRVRFWKLVTELFSENYFRQIYEFCREHGLKLTGHLLMEETLQGQMAASGAAMPHYEYFSIPGVDWLGRKMLHELTWNQVASAAAQLGKPQVLTECFAKCGHNLSFDEMRFMIDQQYLRGVNLLCQHLEGYSLAGIRKRDYPPAMFFQQPWWKYYRLFIDEISRLGTILTQAKSEPEVLLLHPQTSAWILFDRRDPAKVKALQTDFVQQIRMLERKHIPFHLGDELLMERHGRVEGSRLIIGCCAYSRIVLPRHIGLLENTQRLLEAFVRNGGEITTAQDLPADLSVDNPELLCSKRRTQEGKTLQYLLNPTDSAQPFRVPAGTARIELSSGTCVPFPGSGLLEPHESALILEGPPEPETGSHPAEMCPLDLSGEWELTGSTENALVLDFCDYYFDGVLQERNGYVLNIQQRACDLLRPVELRCEFTFTVETLPDSLYLVCENPSDFEIRVNDALISAADCGYYLDKAFRKLDIRRFAACGENRISMRTCFRQTEQVYQNVQRARAFETERNKLSYTMEMEPIYLVGDFGVSQRKLEELPNAACRVASAFSLTAKPRSLTLHQMELQGFPFFAGEMTLRKTVSLQEQDYSLSFPRKTGINAICVKVNGQSCGTLLYGCSRLELQRFLRPGVNALELTFANTLRNLLGPHHLQEGESHNVSPASFYREPCVFCPKPQEWNDNYCLVHMSLL